MLELAKKCDVVVAHEELGLPENLTEELTPFSRFQGVCLAFTEPIRHLTRARIHCFTTKLVISKLD